MANKYLRSLKKPLPLVIIAVMVTASVTLLLTRDEDKITPQNRPATVSVAPSGIKYPDGWQELSEISQSDKQAGVVSEANRSNPSAQAIIRVVDEKLENGFDINKSLSDTVDALKSNLDNFKLVSSDVIRVGKNQAMSITYEDLINDSPYTHTQVIVPAADKSYFLVYSSKSSDYKKLNDFDDVQTAFANYIDSK